MLAPLADRGCIRRVVAAAIIAIVLLRLDGLGKWPSGLWRWPATPYTGNPGTAPFHGANAVSSPVGGTYA